jgi:hypothetical protein
VLDELPDALLLLEEQAASARPAARMQKAAERPFLRPFVKRDLGSKLLASLSSLSGR